MSKPKRTKSAKFDAVQINNGALEQDGKFIAAQIKAMRAYEAAAEEKAGVELKKAQDNRTTVEKRLADVHAKCKAAGFKAFRAMYAPDFGRTKLYALLAIGYGRKTEEQVRAEAAARQANKRVRDNANVTDTSEPAATPPAPVTPAAGNDVDPQVSAAQRKDYNEAAAKAEAGPPPKQAPASKAPAPKQAPAKQPDALPTNLTIRFDHWQAYTQASVGEWSKRQRTEALRILEKECTAADKRDGVGDQAAA